MCINFITPLPPPKKFKIGKSKSSYHPTRYDDFRLVNSDSLFSLHNLNTVYAWFGSSFCQVSDSIVSGCDYNFRAALIPKRNKGHHFISVIVFFEILGSSHVFNILWHTLFSHILFIILLFEVLTRLKIHTSRRNRYHLDYHD